MLQSVQSSEKSTGGYPLVWRFMALLMKYSISNSAFGCKTNNLLAGQRAYWQEIIQKWQTYPLL